MLARLSTQLVRQRHKITIFHFGNSYLESVCKQHNIKHIIIPFENLFRSILTVQCFSIKFAKLLKENSIDVLHSHLYGSIGGSFLGTYLYNIPHVATLHDVYMVQERIGRGALLRLVQAMNVQIVSVSRDMKAFYENYIPLSKSIVNIYNGFQWETEPTDYTGFPPALAHSSRTRIVTVARLIKLKGHEFLLTTLAATLKSSNSELLIVGDGPEYDNLRTQISRLKLQNHVTLLGERNDVQKILSESDVFVLASTSEGLSCSIIEAMSSGLPCIVSKVGGNPELVKEGVNGFLFELGDETKLSSALNTLISDQKKRRLMGKESKLLAEKEFNIDSMVKHYIQQYAKVTSSNAFSHTRKSGL